VQRLGASHDTQDINLYKDYTQWQNIDYLTFNSYTMLVRLGTERSVGENNVGRKPEIKDMRERHTVATAKIRVWLSRADKARKEGRKADADRCDDKVRDWVSKARQIERIRGSGE
jgi:hypothetical protein